MLYIVHESNVVLQPSLDVIVHLELYAVDVSVEVGVGLFDGVLEIIQDQVALFQDISLSIGRFVVPQVHNLLLQTSSVLKAVDLCHGSFLPVLISVDWPLELLLVVFGLLLKAGKVPADLVDALFLGELYQFEELRISVAQFLQHQLSLHLDDPEFLLSPLSTESFAHHVLLSVDQCQYSLLLVHLVLLYLPQTLEVVSLVLTEDGAAGADQCLVLDAYNFEHLLVNEANLLFVQRVVRDYRPGLYGQRTCSLCPDASAHTGALAQFAL